MVDARGRILVTDAGREAIVVFDEAQAALTVWDEAEPGRAFLSPVGIVADGSGGYLVADADIGYLVRLNGSGAPGGDFGRGILQRPTGLSRDPVAREIFVADSGAHDIKVFDEQGEVVGERRFLGLLASSAYYESVLRVPLLREKARRVMAEAGYAPGSHNAKDLLHVLETYPRDELFQTSVEFLVDEEVESKGGIVTDEDTATFVARISPRSRMPCMELAPAQ